jgi:hypothetical protein
MNMRLRVRLAWAFFGIVGLVLEAISSEQSLPGYFTHLSLAVNFFSYFTILTHLFITVWFVLAFITLQRGQAQWWGDRPEIKGALLLAGTVTVMVYWTLLSDIPLDNVSGEIGTFFVHLLVPLGLWIDWLIAGDP